MMGRIASDEKASGCASWRTISSSEEVRDILSGGLATARDLVRQGAAVMADRLSQGGGLRAAA